VTSYSLRSASPAKTRADAVVVGVVAGPKGPQLCDAADDVAKAYGRRLRPFLSTMGVTGKGVPAGTCQSQCSRLTTTARATRALSGHLRTGRVVIGDHG